MEDYSFFDFIIIGGSYAELSSGMALDRAFKKVLIVDSSHPCNIQTMHSHNFLTQDGKTPTEIATLAREQVLHYDTVQFHEGFAIIANQINEGFEVCMLSEAVFKGRKLIFATGVKDIMPQLNGFSACWGKSIIHCPFCHGYEVKKQAYRGSW
jgi:thioredoxin reductase